VTTTIEVHEKTDVILPSPNGGDKSASAVSWGAIFAGAAGAAALSLILLILGSGLGFSSVSPWANDGVSAKTLGISGILWITLTSLAASGLGGYLAGRLRTRWTTTTDRDEVYFRDTAHGFLAWAVATLFTAALLTSSIAAIVSGGIKAGASVAHGVAASAAVAGATAAGAATDSPDNRFGLNGESTGYFIDTLFRRPVNTAPATDPATINNNAASPTLPLPPPRGEYAANAEAARIFINALRNNSLPENDAQYLAQIVASRTDLSQAEAEKRVKDTFNQWQSKLRETEAAAKQTADEARKATAYISLWLFISLLIGAFTASWLATFGGRQRDL